MSKYLSLGFYLSWVAILLIAVGFMVEVMAENMRLRVYVGEVGRAFNISARYVMQEEILNREVLMGRYMARPFYPPTLKSTERKKIIARGLATARYSLVLLIEGASNFPEAFPTLSIEDMKKTESGIQALLDKVEKGEFEDDISSVVNISRQITLLQKEVIDYIAQSTSFDEGVITELEVTSRQSGKFSTRMVLIAFFINLLIFSRIQWLEYKTNRRTKE